MATPSDAAGHGSKGSTLAAWLGVVLLAALIGLVFLPNLRNGLVADDWILLARAAHAHTLADALGFFSFRDAPGWFMRPVQIFLIWALFQAGGSQPLAFHLASALLELANAALVGVLAFRVLMPTVRTRRVALILAALCASLFLFNWSHHETIFWASASNELLVAFFGFLTLLLAIHTVRTPASWSRSAAVWLAGLVCYALALLSKESAVTLPAEVALFLAYFHLVDPHPRRSSWRASGVAIASLLLVTAGWAWAYVSTSPGGSEAVARGGLTLIDYGSPIDLAVRFMQHLNGNFLGLDLLNSWMGALRVELGALAALSILALLRRRFSWLLALGWMILAVAPYAVMTSVAVVRRHVPITTLGIQADRYLYSPSAGAALLLITSGQWLLDEIHGVGLPALEQMTGGMLALVLAALLCLNVYILTWFGAEWKTAGAIAQETIQEVRTVVRRPAAGSTLCLAGLPDAYEGKYVWRNGIGSALRLTFSRDDFAVRDTVEPALPAAPPLDRLLGRDYEIKALRASPRFRAPSLDAAGCSYRFRYDDAIRRLANLDHSGR